MTSLVIEQFATPDTHRKARELELTRRRAADELAGRTVWCITAAPTGTSAAEALQRCLRGASEEGVASHRTSLKVAEPLMGLIKRLDAMLRGGARSAPELAPEAEDTYSRGREDGDALIPGDVHEGDVVVLHDPMAAALAQAIRERGAHAIWRASIGPWESSAAQAWRFLHRSRPGLDAYVMTWSADPAAGSGAGGIAAYISAPGVVYANEPDGSRPTPRYDELGWTTVLAEVVRDDRGERVGGTLHARPTVAAR